MNYEQSNVGLGMVPCKKNCRCSDCTIDRLTAENKAQAETIERLDGALKQYGDHDGDCLIGQEPYYKCDCGFLAALNTTDKVDDDGR